MGSKVKAGKFAELLPKRLRQCLGMPDPVYPGSQRSSLYVPLPDGTEIAVDVFLPDVTRPDEGFPSLFIATRYWRGRQGEDVEDRLKHWVARGFALVVADVRGTGASFGQWFLPYSSQEVADVGYLANWVARQDWSNGRVATTGQSYTGTTALTSPAYGQPAVKAVVSRFSDVDQFTDLNFPGGVVLEQLLRDWGDMVRRLDLNADESGASVRPVDGPRGHELLRSAIEQHRLSEWSLGQAAYQVTYKDELLNQFGGLPIDDSSTFNHQERIEGSGVPIMGWGSWLDAGIAQGMLNRFVDWKVPQLSVIGAWTHGAVRDADQFHTTDMPVDPPVEDQERLYAAFIEPYVGTEELATEFESLLIYYTMGEGSWKSTTTWPLPEAEPVELFFAEDGLLVTERPPTPAFDHYEVDFGASTGPSNRWAAQMGGTRAVAYGDRADMDKRLLVYSTAAIEKDVEVTGHAIVSITLRSNQRDGNIIAYLEDVAPDGRVTYVTEGQLRLLHRKVADEGIGPRTPYPTRSFCVRDAELVEPGEPTRVEFQLMPTSVLFKAGHKIRIAVAGADDGTFLRVPHPARGAVELEVMCGGTDASFVRLPTVPRVTARGA